METYLVESKAKPPRIKAVQLGPDNIDEIIDWLIEQWPVSLNSVAKVFEGSRTPYIQLKMINVSFPVFGGDWILIHENNGNISIFHDEEFRIKFRLVSE